jgi:hypothetical protein
MTYKLSVKVRFEITLQIHRNIQDCILFRIIQQETRVSESTKNFAELVNPTKVD